MLPFELARGRVHESGAAPKGAGVVAGGAKPVAWTANLRRGAVLKAVRAPNGLEITRSQCFIHGFMATPRGFLGF